MTDQELLRNYANGSEAAFTELVRRYVDLVHSVALRIARDSASAQDITQNVFIALAKNSKSLGECSVLARWLHQTTRNVAANSVRSAIRRRVHEQEAATMNELLHSSAEPCWEDIAPQIDEALAELSDSDRDSILIRFFQRKTAREMALALDITDEAAQKRVNRAIERLRELLSKRNLNVGASGLAVAISTNAVQSAPVAFTAGLAGSVLGSVAAMQSAATLVAGNGLGLSLIAKLLIGGALVAVTLVGVLEARRLTATPNPNVAALANPSIGVAAQTERNPSSHPAAGIALQARTSKWTGRKYTHAPTLALAQEDLTNTLIQLGPEADRTPDVWVQRGELHARVGQWNEAVANIRQALVVNPHDSWAGYLLSSALLASGDLAEYQRHSHAMMVKFGNTRDSIVAGRTAEAYLVAPYGENTDLELSVALLERKRFYWWREFYQGLAQYRLGNFAAAAELIEEDIRKLPSVNSIDRAPLEADCFLVLAMARRQLNQPEDAAAALAHGREVAGTQMPQIDSADLGPYWWNGVTTRALLKEASELVEQWSPSPTNAALTFSLSRHAAKSVIPLTGPYSEPTAGPLYIVANSVAVTNGSMQFTIAGVTPGATICVLTAGELFTPSSWIPISTNHAAGTTLTVSGIAATNAHGFFRVLQIK